MVTCAAIASQRGLSVVRYAMFGGLYSALLFLPWTYLVVRMLGGRPNRGAVRTGYVVLFAGWLLGPILGGITLHDVALEVAALQPELVGPPDNIGPTLRNVLPWVNIATWVGSLAWFLHREWLQLNGDMPDEENGTGILLPVGYLVPLGLITFWSIVDYVLGNIQ